MKRRRSGRKQRRPKKPPAVTLRDIPWFVVTLFGVMGRVLYQVRQTVRREREQRKR